MLTYLLFRIATWFARILPPRWGYALARWAGSLIYRLSPMSWAMRDNARHILGVNGSTKKEARAISRLACKNFQSQIMNYYDVLRLSALPDEELKDLVDFQGREHLDRLLASGKGIVLTSAHFGPMEMIMQCTAQLGYPIVGIAEKIEPERLHNFMMKLRTTHGLDLISTDGPLLDAYRRLKRGAILGNALDRDSTNTGIIAPFFGQPAWLPDGYARIAVRTKLPIVLGYGLRTESGIVARLHPPIYPNPALKGEQAVQDLVGRVLCEFESVVRAYPEQWLLSSPLWHLAQERIQAEEDSQ